MLFAVVIPILAIFFYGYFIPAHQLGFIFSASITLALGGQFVAAVVPEVGGWKSRVHRTSAGWSAFGLFAALVSMAYELALPPLLFCFAIAALIIMAFCSGLAFRSFAARRPFEHRYFLWLQVVYYALFFGVVGAVAYFA